MTTKVKEQQKETPVTTDSGIPIRKVYEKKEFNLSAPGEYPFTRGIHPGMYRDRMWTMRQYAGFSTAEESNRRYHYLLQKGTTGLSVAFDLPTQIGYDSDHMFAEGEVGKVGVAIDSLQDVEILFDGITLQDITTSMTINATAPILLAFYIALAKKQGADLSRISGTIQNDILKEYAARGTHRYPPQPSMRLITDVFEYCSQNLPKWNTISISGYHIREAGATAAQELAFTLANGKAYVQAAQAKGLDINVFGKRLSFFFNAHNNFFQEVAKFRAARRMWAQIMTDLGATEPKAQKLRFHAQTGGSTLTATQPLNNTARVTTQALSAVLGGTQSLHTNGYDEALSLPTEQSAQLALRTQQIIAYESGVTDTVDPLAGSYFVEELTNQLEEKAWAYINHIDELGGAVQAIEQGYIQEEISQAAYAYQRAIEDKREIIVGVNRFQTESEEQEADLFKVDPAIQQRQMDKLQKVKQERDNAKAEAKLQAIEQAAATDENLMPYLVDAVEHYATLGEIAEAMRKVFGEYEQ